MLVQIEYTYIFDPKDTWTQSSQLDDDFAKFLAAKGLEAEVIKFTPTGQQFPMPYKRMLFIRRRQTMPAEEKVKDMKSPKDQLKAAMDKVGKSTSSPPKDGRSNIPPRR